MSVSDYIEMLHEEDTDTVKKIYSGKHVDKEALDATFYMLFYDSNMLNK